MLAVTLSAGTLPDVSAAEPPAAPTPFHDGQFALASSDVVAFLGGADVVAAQQTGHLETLLTIYAQSHGEDVRFRNLAWEGDTVFVQPREVGAPSTEGRLESTRATVVFLQFGRTECLEGRARLMAFTAAYAALLDRCAKRTPRLVLVAPPPFEKANELLPNLARHNEDLAAYVSAMRDLAHARRLPFADVFSVMQAGPERLQRTTEDGLQLTPLGHALVASACARELGLAELLSRAGAIKDSGAWSHPSFERLRQAIIRKNQLWFDYSRPQNWAFLGGDRTTQPSSRDHRDPKVRWFPAEMERFLPLITTQESEIRTLAGQLSR
jgi:hypothetical protein